MNFKEAYQKMQEGKKVRRKGRSWCCFYDSNENKFCTGDGVAITGITFEAALAEDWEVVGEREVVEEPKWKPREGELYFYINSNGEIEYRYYKNRNINDKRRICNIGNYFKTDEEAEHMVEKLKVIKELQDFAIENRDEEISWEEDDEYNRYKYSIYFDYRLESIRVNWTTVAHDSPFNLYFTSLEIAKEAIKKIGEDRIKKYYFDIED